MSQYADNEILLYDLGNRPASFDFVTCLSTAITNGAKHVRFVYGKWKPKNYTLEQAQERWKSIVEPAVKLFGISYSIGERRGVEWSHFLPKTVEAYRKHGRIAKIVVPAKVRQPEYITLTLRKSRTPARDSKEAEWMEFASRVRDRDVVVIRDYEERPISLEDRMALYAGAWMNLMVINGPLTLCIHSDAPYISMRTIGCESSGSTSPRFMEQIGITPGFQFPWANANQRLSYLDDTADNIEAEYRAMERLMQERQAA